MVQPPLYGCGGCAVRWMGDHRECFSVYLELHVLDGCSCSHPSLGRMSRKSGTPHNSTGTASSRSSKRSMQFMSLLLADEAHVGDQGPKARRMGERLPRASRRVEEVYHGIPYHRPQVECQRKAAFLLANRLFTSLRRESLSLSTKRPLRVHQRPPLVVPLHPRLRPLPQLLLRRPPGALLHPPPLEASLPCLSSSTVGRMSRRVCAKLTRAR